MPDVYDEPVPRPFCRCNICNPAEPEPPRAYTTSGRYYGTRNWKFQGRSPFYGFELEMPPTRAGWRLAYGYLGDVIAEVKPDTGMEITTHPMSLSRLMRHYPWPMLPALRDTGCGEEPDGHGLHVHVNKNGFTGADHMFNWLSVLYAAPREMHILGGRTNRDHWTRGQDAANIRSRAQYWQAIEDGKALRHEAAVHAAPMRSGLILRKTDRGKLRAFDRVNPETRRRFCPGVQGGAVDESRHSDTFEVRFPGSSLQPRLVKSRVQLVAATVEYARQLPGTGAAGHQFSEFAGWVSGRRRYADLASVISERL